MVNSGRVTPEYAYASIQSTKGWLGWANTYNLKIALDLKNIEKEINNERYQMVFTEDPQCKLYRLGFSKQEASDIINK